MLLNDGVEVIYLDHSIKLLKASKVYNPFDGIIPSPSTYARMAWYAQNGELFELDEIIDIGALHNILVLWELNEQLRLKDLLLIIPGIGEPPLPIPHPATLGPAQEPPMNNIPPDIREVEESDELEDLDIDETGTDEP